MGLLANLFTGIRALLRKQQTEEEMDEELTGYLEASVAEKLRSGMPLNVARLSAVRDLGGTRNSVKHHVWSSRWESTLDSTLQDICMSVRSLLKSPGFTAIALL